MDMDIEGLLRLADKHHDGALVVWFSDGDHPEDYGYIASLVPWNRCDKGPLRLDYEASFGCSKPQPTVDAALADLIESYLYPLGREAEAPSLPEAKE